MLLPNELLLEALRFVDFGTLLSAKFVDARFLDVVAKFAALLARRRSFQVLFYPSYITYIDVTVHSGRKSIRYETGDRPSLAAACGKLAAIIGAHVVVKLTFCENTWNAPGLGVIFDATPALKYAEAVGLRSPPGSITENGCQPFMHNLAGTKSLCFSLTYHVFRQLSWTFLGGAAAHELRHVSVDIYDIDCLPENATDSIEELVGHCVRRPRPLAGEALELDFSLNYLPEDFAIRIIEVCT
ncbi:hypothetical protein AAVH_28168 [Aphelenchoides avenae]|nr:hypothetical protein AAVH_28168 [Aphelenchus avenae]